MKYQVVENICYFSYNFKKMTEQLPEAALVPTLYMNDLKAAIEFYRNAFGATERWRVDNGDGTIHVAEMTIPPVVFRIHEEVQKSKELSPQTAKGTTTIIGLLVHDPDKLAERAVKAGAEVLSPMKDYEYGYRQGTIKDPFGHHWCLERIDSLAKKPNFNS